MIQSIQSTALVARHLRFSAESGKLVRSFAQTSLERHDNLAHNRQTETINPTTPGQRLKRATQYVMMILATAGALWTGNMQLNKYRSQELTPEQVATEEKMQAYQAEMSRAVNLLPEWTKNAGIKPETRIFSVNQLDSLKQTELSFFSSFYRVLAKSTDPEDQALTAKMTNLPVFETNAEVLTEELMTYLKEQDSKGGGLAVEAFIAKQPALSQLGPRQQEYVSAQIAKLYNEEPTQLGKTKIQNLIGASLFSKLSDLGLESVLEVKTPEQVMAFFEKGANNPAVFSKLTPKEREQFIKRGKEYLSALSYQPVKAPAGSLWWGAMALLAAGLAGSVTTIVVSNKAIREKLQERRQRMDLLAGDRPVLLLQRSRNREDEDQQFGRQLIDSAQKLYDMREYALQNDPAIKQFFMDVYPDKVYHGSVKLPGRDTLETYYRNRAQDYFLTVQKQKVVPYEACLQKAAELAQTDLDNQEYLPELAFDNTANVPRMMLEEVDRHFSQEQLNQVMARIDADVLDNIKLEMNQRILMTETLRRLTELESKTAEAQRMSAANEPAGINTESSRGFSQKALEQMQKHLDHILQSRVALEENRLNWQMTYLRINQNAEYQNIVETLQRARAKAKVVGKEGDDEALRTLQANLRVSDRAVASQIQNLQQQQEAVMTAMQTARSQKGSGS